MLSDWANLESWGPSPPLQRVVLTALTHGPKPETTTSLQFFSSSVYVEAQHSFSLCFLFSSPALLFSLWFSTLFVYWSLLGCIRKKQLLKPSSCSQKSWFILFWKRPGYWDFFKATWAVFHLQLWLLTSVLGSGLWQTFHRSLEKVLGVYLRAETMFICCSLRWGYEGGCLYSILCILFLFKIFSPVLM